MFIDQAEIFIAAGDGGNGCVSFRREKYVPKGGPDGGDGGNGGSVFFQACTDVDTLLDFTGHHHWTAPRGEDGMGDGCNGKSGEDLIIKVPVGTIIYDADRNFVIKDLNEPEQMVRLARGGKGGKGNKQFATATNQVPRYAEPGRPGRQRHLRLELKLVADVGLVGLPNAGKSTLLSRISAARPKIAPYPFTTLTPNLGIIELSEYRRFVVSDVPGLIEGAHRGQGLGHDFLRHIERTRVILHLVDIAPLDGSNPYDNYQVIRQELVQYSPRLGEKPEIVVASKMDLDPQETALAEFHKQLGRKVLPLCAVSGKNIAALCEILWTKIQELKAQEASENTKENV